MTQKRIVCFGVMILTICILLSGCNRKRETARKETQQMFTDGYSKVGERQKLQMLCLKADAKIAKTGSRF